MSLQTDVRRSARPVAVEFGVVTAALVCVSLWVRLVHEALAAVSGPGAVLGGNPLLAGLVNGGVVLAGLVSLAGAYAAVRDVDVGLTIPDATDLPTVVAVALLPPALVACTKLVGVATDVPYNALTKSSVGADAPLGPILLVAGLGLLVGVPSLVVVCQVLVQGGFRRVVDGDAAAAATTLVTGFLLVGDAGGLATVPARGRLAGAAVFAVLLGVAVASERVDRRWLRYAALAPALAFVALAVLSGVAGVTTIAGGLFALTQFATLGVAAYAFDRTGSLLVPALAYVSFLLADRAVVVALEMGLRSW